MGIFGFIFSSVFLGVGLAMDAFSVSVANGINEPKMRIRKALYIAGAFAVFQFLMPMLGWVCIKTISEAFDKVQKYLPWASLVLLVFIGGKMILEGLGDHEQENARLSAGGLLVQAVATSIDALSVGFTIVNYNLWEALFASVIIGAVTLAVCLAGLKLGKRLGIRLASRAGILGGTILIIIGFKIFFS